MLGRLPAGTALLPGPDNTRQLPAFGTSFQRLSPSRIHCPPCAERHPWNGVHIIRPSAYWGLTRISQLSQFGRQWLTTTLADVIVLHAVRRLLSGPINHDRHGRAGARAPRFPFKILLGITTTRVPVRSRLCATKNSQASWIQTTYIVHTIPRYSWGTFASD